MRRHMTGWVLAALGWVLTGSGPSRASPPANTLVDLGQALTACFEAPADSTGSELTVRLALTREGTLLGKPRVTYTHLVGDASAQRAFVVAALASLARCTPVTVTPDLGGAIAGRLFSIRFQGGPPPRSI